MKKLIMLGLVVTMMGAAGMARAEEVFKTARGKKFHQEICRLIKNKDALSKIDREEAEELGLTPCKRCFNEGLMETAETEISE